MHDDLQELNLTFPLIPTGAKETPLSLKRLLYKGGTALRTDQAEKAIQEGWLGEVQPDRIELVSLIHASINTLLTAGGSRTTARAQIREISTFFEWGDGNHANLSLTGVIKSYIDWSEYLLRRVRIKKDLKQGSAYNHARMVGQLLDDVLDRTKPVLTATRIKRPTTRKTVQGVKADKQNLQETFAFGRLLQDICDGTPLDIIWNAPIVRIPMQQGGNIEFRFGREAAPDHARKQSEVYKSRERVLEYKNDRSLNNHFRMNMVNLRIQSELLMFIGQTGMNLTQAHNLPLRRFSFSSDINGYKVREYKHRRKGEVLFEIFTEYRGHFERYLEWRRQIFGKAEQRLFPFIRQDGVREEKKVQFSSVKNACKKASVTWVPPSTLRGTRVNWILRRSNDPDLTAEMAQHHIKTLLSDYETPSQQRAASEIIRFHFRTDPSLNDEAILLAVAPGECNGVPKRSADKPLSATEPDCRRPSGCLWCDHHRDIDSLDYVWSMACFRHLKTLELSKASPKNKRDQSIHPAEHAIKKLGEKLKVFQNSNSTRREWVEEALARLEEGYYHEQWSYLIESLEGSVK
ncbi:site-specific integrase [Massilia sp. YIM B02763]|uniref:site-specific integrase n=1 Tax=Massilia sp. YIM B02763 TaxID=3050130 RepID=UPI0025B653FC|nr:site-specific integrase [Massilia sp. YIM B02763]MDN4054203.1 site-specific integrase [Massilia sp. YIM B02763]